MTFVTLRFTPSEVGFSNYITSSLMLEAKPYIRENLDNVLAFHDDRETRANDSRRTHSPLNESRWIIRLKRNSITFTNTINDPRSLQFRALYSGNGNQPICARHMTRRMHKGWSNNDRHASVGMGGKKPTAGTYGEWFPGMLKFYDKRNGTWQYRHCVKPISASIINDFDRDLRTAVLSGLETAYSESYADVERGNTIPNDPDFDPDIDIEERNNSIQNITSQEQDEMDTEDNIVNRETSEEINKRAMRSLNKKIESIHGVKKKVQRGGGKR